MKKKKLYVLCWASIFAWAAWVFGVPVYKKITHKKSVAEDEYVPVMCCLHALASVSNYLFQRSNT
ncbi:MAG: hypothetical protein LUE86_07540 [Clostridiales bacterium]|nr:hypothetical protein [Clostridiales bacterium]